MSEQHKLHVVELSAAGLLHVAAKDALLARGLLEIEQHSKIRNALSHYFRGAAYYHSQDRSDARGEFDEAIRLLEEITANDPSNIAALRHRAKAKWVKAILIELLADDGENGSDVDWSLRDETFRQAFREIEEAIRLDPSNPVVHVEYSELLFWGGSNNEKAIRELDEAIRLDPSNPAWRALRAFEQEESRVTDDWLDNVIADLRDSHRLNGGQLDIEIVFTEIDGQELSIAKYDGGNPFLHAGIKIDLRVPLCLAYRRRASAWIEKGDLGRAIEDLDAFIRLDNDNASALESRGYVWFQKGEFDKALRDLSESIRIDPSTIAFFWRGRTWFSMNEYDNAFRDFDQTLTGRQNLEWSPVTIETRHFWRGIALRRRAKEGDKEAAIHDFTAAIAKDPKYAEAYWARALSFVRMGRTVQAFADLNEAIRIDPNQGRFFQDRGDLYLAQCQHARAISDFDTAISLYPHSYYCHSRRAEALRASGVIFPEPKAAVEIRVPGKLVLLHLRGSWREHLVDCPATIEINEGTSQLAYERVMASHLATYEKLASMNFPQAVIDNARRRVDSLRNTGHDLKDIVFIFVTREHPGDAEPDAGLVYLASLTSLELEIDSREPESDDGPG